MGTERSGPLHPFQTEFYPKKNFWRQFCSALHIPWLVCVNYCKVLLLPLQELSAMVLLLEGHNSLLPLQLFSPLYALLQCVCVHVMFLFATRMQLKVQLACGTACNILGKAFFFPLFLSLFQAVESYHYLPYEGVVGKTRKMLVWRNGCGFITNHNCHPNDEREFQRAQD